MAGHSKFKNIMHRKGAQDARRAKIFAKLAREITVAAKTGGEDPNMNARLRLAISAGRAQNMPNENIQRSIVKAVGGGEGADFEEVRYEGFGPKGVAIIVEALTDNRNRTAAEVRAAFTKFGGTLGETGSVSFLFDRVGVISYPENIGSDEEIFEAALSCGAKDVEQFDNCHVIVCSSSELSVVRDILEQKFGSPQSAILEWRPQSLVSLTQEPAASVIKLLETLEDNDDVQRVAFNLEVDDDTLNLLSA